MNLSMLLTALPLCVLMTQSWCMDFTYPIFHNNDISGFITSGTSDIVFDAIQVTADANALSMFDQWGWILYSEPLKLWRSGKEGSPVVASFNSTFTINITPVPRNNKGGEGLAFILTGDTTAPTNSQGMWLGLVNSSTNGSAQNRIVAIEFDNLKSNEEDIDSNHVGLDVNSISSVKQVSLSSIGVNLSSATDINFTVTYDGANISVFVNGTRDIFSMPIALAEYLPKEIYVGFSASTGNLTQLNCVRSWAFEGTDIGEEQRSLMWVWIFIPALAVIVGIVVLYLYWKRRNYDCVEDSSPQIEVRIEGSTMVPRKFQLRHLKNATGGFSSKNMLGKGGFGTVYKGHLLGRDVAVKRISENSRQGIPEFLAEITTIGSLHHRNLVKLIGWSYERHELLLVYEYMPHGSLDKFIYQNNKLMTEELFLDWKRRYNIICGIAQALDYLHNGCERRVLHRDVKASNIMLDLDFNARLGDFGLARTIQQTEQTYHSTNEIAGTPGYMAPESLLIGRATVETDIYAFGVLMFTVVCGRRPGEQNVENNIVYWMWELHRKGRITSGIDSRLQVDSEMESVLMLALACCHPNPHHRPSTRTVVQVLAGEASTPPVPLERPPFIWPAIPPSFKRDSSVSLTDGQTTPITELTGR